MLEWLSDRSLLTFSLDGQVVSVHRLVAQVIRHELDRRQMLTAVCEAAAFVLDVYRHGRSWDHGTAGPSGRSRSR